MLEATELLTANEMAERLRVASETVLQWARSGVIPSLRISHKVIRFDPVMVVAALKDRAKGDNLMELSLTERSQRKGADQ